MARRRFLELSDAGGDSRRTPRSSVEPQGSLEFLESFQCGRWLAPRRRRPVVKIDAPAPLEDLPWSFKVPVVSERLRTFLENEAPGNAQFFEARIVGPKRLLPKEPYYLVNWLHVVDCIDLDKSEWDDQDPPTGDPAQYDYWRIVVDPSRVPADVFVFRLKYFHVTIVIDQRLAQKIRKQGFTGPQFYDLSRSIFDEMR
jgi:hypothetical protein